MEKVQLQTVNIPSVNNIFELIKNLLLLCIDSQIFISDNLLSRILRVHKKEIIWEENVIDSFQYSNNVEKAYLFSFSRRNHAATYQIHLVKNCSDFTQIAFFATENLVYRHYLKGLKKIIILTSD